MLELGGMVEAEGREGLYLMKNKGKQLQYNLEIDLQAELSFVKIIFL